MIYYRILKQIRKEFTNNQIEKIMKEKKLSRLESLLYLYLFNYFNITPQDVVMNNGQQVYIKLVKCISNLFNKKDI